MKKEAEKPQYEKGCLNLNGSGSKFYFRFLTLASAPLTISKITCTKPAGSYLCHIMLKILFYLFVLYLLYKLIFDFIIPVSKATSQVKSRFKEMHEQQQFQQQKFEQQRRQQTSSNQASANTSKDDYIDFEEVK